MPRKMTLAAVLCLVALGAAGEVGSENIEARAPSDAAVAPQQATSLKPQAASFGADAITIPQMLSYQGKLSDTFGLPVADTLYALRFRLYAQPTGGTQFWEENQNVRTTGGLFSVLLGSVTPIGSVPDAGAAYLGMAVAGGAEMTPRLRIASAAYAYLTTRAANSDLLQGRDTTTFSRSTHNHDATYVNEAQADAVTSAMIVNGTVAAADLNQMGAASGQVMKWTGSAWAPRNDSVGGSGGVPDSVPGSFAVTTDLRVYGKGRIGLGNSNAGNAAFVAGEGNTASANYSSVSGGADNTASGVHSHISGGGENRAAGDYSTVGGGGMNYASGGRSAVAGGSDNEAYGHYAAIGGGRANLAGDAVADTAATVAGGYGNIATAKYSSIGGGYCDTASGTYAFIGGGIYNAATGDRAMVGGGSYNNASGDEATVGGGNSNEASHYRAAVGGGNSNEASGDYSVVGGGNDNTASGLRATVAGGASNDATRISATVSGGESNNATGEFATVGGGLGNNAGGGCATIPGGRYNAAGGRCSFATGEWARANHNGCFVWGDSVYDIAAVESIYTTGINQWRVRARGGAWFFSNLGMTTGAYLAPGSNAWVSACDSATKEDFREVDRRELLDKVAALRVRDYKMKDQDDGTRHIGPVAQDFHAAFGYGETETGINTADADGVALAAIQALYDEMKARDEAQQLRIAQLEAELVRMKK